MKCKKFLNILIAIVLVVQTLLLCAYVYLDHGYTLEDFENLNEKDIEKFTYSYAGWPGEYEIEDGYEKRILMQFLYNLKLFVCTDDLPVDIVETQYSGITDDDLHVYMKNGNVYTIQHHSGQTVLGRDFSIVRINGATYLADTGYNLYFYISRFSKAWEVKFPNWKEEFAD